MTKRNILAISLLGFVLLPYCLCSVACGSGSANERRAQEELVAAAEKDQRPINFTFRMVDQDGNGARNFRFKLNLDRLHRFLWIWPYTFEECHYVSTDENGYVRMVMPGKKASYVAFKEVDIDEYIFSKGLEKLSLAPMSMFTDVAKPVELKVIRHGPVARLDQFSTHVQDFPAKDMNSIIFNPNSSDRKSGLVEDLTSQMNEINDARPKEGLLIRIENARRAAQEEWELIGKTGAIGRAAHVAWSVTIDGNGKYLLKETDNDFVSYAPLDGYKHSLTWDTRIEPEKRAGISGNFYAREIKSGKYFWLNIGVGLGPRGTFSVHVEGCSNPDGSDNLYRDRWPYRDEFKRYSERCP